MGQVLQQRMRQSARLSPTMRLEMSLLALPIDELKTEVKRELDTNPAIEGSFPLYLPHLPGLTGANGFLLDNARAHDKTLTEHLLGELRMSGLEGRDLEIATAIVCNLNESGYFEGSYPDIIMELSGREVMANENDLEAMRRKVMQIDPKGCGARTLEECLAAQLNRLPVSEREKVARLLPAMCEGKASREELEYLKPLIAKLKPAPGKDFEYVKIDYVTPDITVDSEGEVMVDTHDIPELKVSQKYIEMAKDRELDKETREYAAAKVKRAREFTAALERRQDNLGKIAEYAIGAQSEFLKHGAMAIRQLTMSDVAKAVKCSVSTVSRAAKRKFVRTPRGTLPLRKFFALEDQAPYEKLRELLSSFPEGRRPSDQKLSEMMKAAGYPMARRTVAKWRMHLI